jgi:hypothetical protein
LLYLSGANSFTFTVISGAVTTVATTATGQGITLPRVIFRKLLPPQALHREPATADHDHAGYGSQKRDQHRVMPPAPQSP